jgi:hypothetical protein
MSVPTSSSEKLGSNPISAALNEGLSAFQLPARSTVPTTELKECYAAVLVQRTIAQISQMRRADAQDYNVVCDGKDDKQRKLLGLTRKDLDFETYALDEEAGRLCRPLLDSYYQRAIDRLLKEGMIERVIIPGIRTAYRIVGAKAGAIAAMEDSCTKAIEFLKWAPSATDFCPRRSYDDDDNLGMFGVHGYRS